MHIGVLTHNYPRFAGDFSGIFIEALSEEFARQQHRVTVWAPYDPAYRRRAQALSSAPAIAPTAPPASVSLQLYRYAWPARLHRLGYMRSMQSDLALRLETYFLSPAFFASGIATVLRGAARVRPDVLHAHWVLPNGFIAAFASRRLGIPLVVSVPGSDAQVAGKNPLFRAMARFAFRQASLLTANSAELRDAVVALGADPAKFDLIIYGVDPQALRPEKAGVAALRAQWTGALAPVLASRPAAVGGGDPVYLLCVGRMVHKKGFDGLLRALATEPLRSANVAAVMVGAGDEQKAWQQLAAEVGVADRILWLGTVPNDQIRTVYNAADILVMPSVSRPADGLNVCVLDAMSCARPVVASNVAGNPLAVTEGVTGFIVPEQDPVALSQALGRLVSDADLRQRMGAAGRARIESELGWPHLAQRYLRHFEAICHRSSRVFQP